MLHRRESAGKFVIYIVMKWKLHESVFIVLLHGNMKELTYIMSYGIYNCLKCLKFKKNERDIYFRILMHNDPHWKLREQNSQFFYTEIWKMQRLKLKQRQIWLYVFLINSNFVPTSSEYIKKIFSSDVIYFLYLLLCEKLSLK